MNRRRTDDDSGLLRRYLEEISKYQPIPAEREKELARIIQDRFTPEEKRKEAIDELVRANLRFVVYHAKGFHSPDVPFIDLINEGNIGLIQAAKRFDADRGVKFITYAVWWVRQAISHALAEQAGTIRIPHKQAAHQLKAIRARAELQRELGREPTHEEIAERTGLEPADGGGPPLGLPHGRVALAGGRKRRAGSDARGRPRADDGHRCRRRHAAAGDDRARPEHPGRPEAEGAGRPLPSLRDPGGREATANGSR